MKVCFCAFLLLFFNFAAAEEFYSVAQWIQEAERFVSEGNVSQAILTAKEALRLDPENLKAKELLERLSQPVAADEGQKNWEEGEKLWQEAIAHYKQGRQIPAFLKLREAKHFFQQSSARPPYFSELDGMLGDLDRRLQRELSEQLKVIGSLEDPVAAGIKLQKILSWYPDYEPAKKEWNTVVARLNRRSEEAWMRAETLRQLEGCEAAFAALQRAKTLAHFETVPIWQQASQSLAQCRR